MISTTPEFRDGVSVTEMLPWVRYAEIWRPAEEGSVLARTQTVITGEPITSIPAASLTTKVECGQGIVGQAWHQKCAIIFHEQPSHLLDEISETSGVELTAVVVIPIFRQHEICGVVVLGLGPGHGALEVWSRDERDELGVCASYYHGLPTLEFITRYTRLPRGSSLPGKVWKTEEPKLIRNPAESEDFVRSFGTDPANIQTAIGIPVGSSHGFAGSVLVLLNDSHSPAAHATELWFCEPKASEDADDDEPDATIKSVESVDGAAGSDGSTNSTEEWRQRMLQKLKTSVGPTMVPAEVVGLEAGIVLGLPIYHGKNLSAVLALRFLSVSNDTAKAL